MATPIVKNEHGTFGYNSEFNRWVCLNGKIPGGGSGPHSNCFVYLAYAEELFIAAKNDGFTTEDFGILSKTEKVKKVRIPGERRVKPNAKYAGEILFDFSE